LESHYRSQSKFSLESLAAAKSRLLRYHNFAVRRFQSSGNSNLDIPDLLSQMQNDLNTPEALAILETWLDQADIVDLSTESIENAINLIDNLLGLELNETKDISEESKQLITERDKARAEMDWAKADALRNQLEKANITVLDRPSGSVWQYLS
ncbi:MAG: CysS/YqeB C-terminal domain-containing protein, partial [Candidatus Saccharimonadales bacterium]